MNVHFFVDRSKMNVSQYVQALKDYVDISVPEIQAKHAPVTGLPIAIGEVSISPLPSSVLHLSHHRLIYSQFWLTGASDAEAGDLMNELLPWLDSNDNILFYQAVGGLFEGQFVNTAGTGLTAAGAAYGELAP